MAPKCYLNHTLMILLSLVTFFKKMHPLNLLFLRCLVHLSVGLFNKGRHNKTLANGHFRGENDKLLKRSIKYLLKSQQYAPDTHQGEVTVIKTFSIHSEIRGAFNVLNID